MPERKEGVLILRLLTGEHGDELAGTARDMTGLVGSASERVQGLKPNAAPALAEPALTAVKVRDQRCRPPACA